MQTNKRDKNTDKNKIYGNPDLLRDEPVWRLKSFLTGCESLLQLLKDRPNGTEAVKAWVGSINKEIERREKGDQ